MPEMDGFELVTRIKADSRMRASLILMLTSGGYSGDVARVRELGIDAYLTKPVAQTKLQAVLLKMLGARTRDVSSAGEAARRLAADRHRDSLRILVAEDNRVNQTLALRMLEKYGHQVVLASNGREALAELECKDFDLVLMDVQMPELDGLETTAIIRGRETGGNRHLPIIAMTAHAMKGDREHCLAAGMDGYVSKPIRAPELWAAIEAVTAASASLSPAV